MSKPLVAGLSLSVLLNLVLLAAWLGSRPADADETDSSSAAAQTADPAVLESAPDAPGQARGAEGSPKDPPLGEPGERAAGDAGPRGRPTPSLFGDDRPFNRGLVRRLEARCGLAEDGQVHAVLRRPGADTEAEVELEATGASGDCVEREMRRDFEELEGEHYVTFDWSAGRMSASISREPPLHDRHLGVPGVDPVAVAQDCRLRQDAVCVRRALTGTELNLRTRSMLLWALATEHDVAAMRRVLAETPPDQLTEGALSPYQAMLWRADHDLPLGDASDPRLVPPVY